MYIDTVIHDTTIIKESHKMSKSEIKSRIARIYRSGWSFLMLLFAVSLMAPQSALASENKDSEEGFDVKEIIFEHLGDGYGWEVPFSHSRRIPLPVIVRAEDGSWFCFSSAGLTKVETVEHDGKSHDISVPVVKTVDRDGKEYRFIIARVSNHKDKVVEIFPLTPEDQKIIDARLADIKKTGAVDNGAQVIDGYVYQDGQYYREYRPLDLSITKNVAALFIVVILVIAMVFGLVNYYRRSGLRAPRKGMGFFEMLVGFIYYDTIKATLGESTRKFAPYLLTAFFFILTMNLVGLIVIFPGGANLTGNIAVTLVLALCTFIITNIFGKKHYWKEIFWPDVPLFLKFPLPIMQVIEVFGIFTKPAALCVRLFANMMGGHIIVITLTLLIFIFAAFGAAAAGGATVISVLFSIFMLLLDVLVSFIQAYVFTLLSALFIGMSQAHEEEHKAKEDNDNPALESKDMAVANAEKARLAAVASDIDMKN